MDKKIYLRESGILTDDIITGEKFLSLTSEGFLNEALLKRRPFTLLCGAFTKSPLSGVIIKNFIEKNKINTEEMRDDVSSFKSFNDFFIRRLKPGARPFSSDPHHLISPCDSRLSVINIKEDTVLDIKGNGYTAEELLCSRGMAKNFTDGLCLIFRLAPDDYHRFIFFDDCFMTRLRCKDGYYNSVNTMFVPLSVHAKNYRQMCLLQTKNFGLAAQVEVGAMNVGSIVQNHTCGHFARGEEKGYFEFGGSTVILLLKKDTVKIDDDIMEYSSQGIEARIRQGETIGVKIN